MRMECKLAEEAIRKPITRSRNYVSCGIDLQEKEMTSETYLQRLSASVCTRSYQD